LLVVEGTTNHLQRTAGDMSTVRKPLDLDIRWVFSRAFLLIFMVCQFVLWHHLRRIAMGGMRQRGLFLGPVVAISLRTFVFSLLLAGFFTLLMTLIVRGVLRPVLNHWLRPSVDPSGGLFHLTASEVMIAYVPARRKSGWNWQPGALVLTDRRIWFFPSGWDGEPWYLDRGEIDRCETELPALAGLVPLRNWPALLRMATQHGPTSIFAVHDPAAALSWFAPAQNADHDGVSLGKLRQGVS
jgi:hypothetical protein